MYYMLHCIPENNENKYIFNALLRIILQIAFVKKKKEKGRRRSKHIFANITDLYPQRYIAFV